MHFSNECKRTIHPRTRDKIRHTHTHTLTGHAKHRRAREKEKKFWVFVGTERKISKSNKEYAIEEKRQNKNKLSIYFS